MQSVLTFEPGPQRPTRDVYLLSARERTDGGYRGNYASVTLAAAPFPIPIAFAVPSGSTRSTGCGRTP